MRSSRLYHSRSRLSFGAISRSMVRMYLSYRWILKLQYLHSQKNHGNIFLLWTQPPPNIQQPTISLPAKDVVISSLQKKKSVRIVRIKKKVIYHFSHNVMLFRKETNWMRNFISIVAAFSISGALLSQIKCVRERVSDLIHNPDNRPLWENIVHFLAPHYFKNK